VVEERRREVDAFGYHTRDRLVTNTKNVSIIPTQKLAELSQRNGIGRSVEHAGGREVVTDEQCVTAIEAVRRRVHTACDV